MTADETSRDYVCPVHGRISLSVRWPAPDVMPCPLDSWSPPGSDKEYATREDAEAVCLEAGYYPGQARLETQRCADSCQAVPDGQCSGTSE